VPLTQFGGCCVEGGIAFLPLSYFDCFCVSVLLEGNPLLSGISSGGDVDRCVEGNVALPLNLFVSCRNSSHTLVNVSFLLDCNGLSHFFFFVASDADIVNPPLTLSVDVDVRLTFCFDLLGSVGLLFVGVLLNFSMCLLLMMWWLRKHLLCHLQLFTLIRINNIS
jgi:hypothetical protein